MVVGLIAAAGFSGIEFYVVLKVLKLMVAAVSLLLKNINALILIWFI